MLYEFFISAGNGSISETFFSLNASDLPNASTKELESNNFVQIDIMDLNRKQLTIQSRTFQTK